jgi:glutathione S-transferase
MIKIYGSLTSRATRNLWMLDELGVDYEHVVIDMAKEENRSPAFLKINPAGKIPALTDGDAALSESLAINLYLAQKYGGKTGLWPEDDAGRARCMQWSVWAAGELEPVAFARVVEVVFKEEAGRDQDLLNTMAEKAGPMMDLINGTLEESEYLAGPAFTVADLNVACVMEYLDLSQFKFTPWPKAEAWFQRTYNRPANKKIQDARAPLFAELMKQMRG